MSSVQEVGGGTAVGAEGAGGGVRARGEWAGLASGWVAGALLLLAALLLVRFVDRLTRRILNRQYTHTFQHWHYLKVKAIDLESLDRIKRRQKNPQPLSEIPVLSVPISIPWFHL